MSGPSFTAKITGLARLRRRIDAQKVALVTAGQGALYQMGEEVMSASKKITPVDEGVLRASGHVQPPVVDPVDHTIYVELGFGGPAGSGDGQTKDVGYAVYVHEDLNARHTVGQAKYLEEPVDRARSGFSRRFGALVRRRLRP